jgi:hypothetical protein
MACGGALARVPSQSPFMMRFGTKRGGHRGESKEGLLDR